MESEKLIESDSEIEMKAGSKTRESNGRYLLFNVKE